MNRRRKLAIYGAGGFAREVAWLLSSARKPESCDLLGYIQDEVGPGTVLNGLPVFSLDDLQSKHPESAVSIAVGNPAIRQSLVTKTANAGFEFATLIHSTVESSDFNTLGTGTIVCCGSILTVNVAIGDHVHINLDCTIGHDVKIGDYSTLSPGVHVSGNVEIGKRVHFGTGVTVVNGTSESPLKIANDCVIGAGACVANSLDTAGLYVGVPAKLKKSFC